MKVVAVCSDNNAKLVKTTSG